MTDYYKANIAIEITIRAADHDTAFQFNNTLAEWILEQVFHYEPEPIADTRITHVELGRSGVWDW